MEIRERSEKDSKTENSVRIGFFPLHLLLQKAYKSRHGQLVFTQQEDDRVCSRASIKRDLKSFLLKLSKASGESGHLQLIRLQGLFATMCFDAG